MRLRFFTVLCLFVLGACQGSEEGNEICFCGSDASLPTDAGEQQACDPVRQEGCGTGEKCAQIVASDDPFLARTACVPEGMVPLGGTCLRGDAASPGGFSDCISGTECINETCRAICTLEPDGCRSAKEPFGSGEQCAVSRGYFGGTPDIGLCVNACDPSNESQADGELVNASCDEGDTCTLNGCASTLPEAQEGTQNRDCYGPGLGGCLANGCAPGFAPLLPNSPDDSSGFLCVRFCSPVNSHSSAIDAVAGANGNCSPEALNELGGTNGEASAHQCRFLQSFSLLANSEVAPPVVGFCVPTLPVAGGTWGDCTELDWDGLKVEWLDGAADPEQRAKLFESRCLSEPSQPAQYEDVCLGLRRGCISLEEIALGFAP